MSLVAALVSLATAADASTLALLLTVYTVAYVVIAAIENAPALAPSVIFGFIVVPVWRTCISMSRNGVLLLAYCSRPLPPTLARYPTRSRVGRRRCAQPARRSRSSPR
jgi:hypothetical protein